jgi:outer membrane protein assembly factor BamB
MKRFFFLPLLICCLAFAFTNVKITDFSNDKICDLPVNWSTPIGNVSFRTNVDFLENNLVIGSNGGNYMDYFIDKGNGIYILDSKTGKIQLNFANEKLGDMDVNGVLIYDDKIYFGNDNDEIICADKKGKIIFRQDASGDVEHRPILIKTSNQDQIVFAMETGEVRSINPKNGTVNWSFYHPNFEGYKSNDNRTAFKLKMHFYSGEKFFVEPMVVDINKDNVADLVYNSDDSEIFAINGKNGKLITHIATEKTDQYYGVFLPSMYRTTPFVFKFNQESFFMIPFQCHFDEDYEGKRTVTEFRFYNLSGKEIRRIKMKQGMTFGYGRQQNNRVFFAGQIVDFSNGLDNYEIIPFQKEPIRLIHPPRISKETINLNGDECIVMSYEWGFQKLNQEKEDYNSDLCVFNISKRKFEKIIHFQTSSEFNPILGDFNSDNKVDILLGCHNGMLYNFDLGYPASSIIH